MIRPALIRPGEEGNLVAMAAAAHAAPPAAARGIFWLDERDEGTRLYDVVMGVAIIGVKGYLLDVLSYGGGSWATGYNVLQIQIEHALLNPNVRAIALDIDSGGGMCSGCFELVSWIHEAKAAAAKPIVAIVNSRAFSAAYAIASSADAISAPRTGGVGSIGVVMVHFEYSGWLKQSGLTPTMIYSGKHKVDGNPYEPLPKAVAADFKATTDELRQIFADAVAVGRGGAGLDARTALATEAYSYERPSKIEEAKRLGLIDAVMHPDEALAELVEAVTA